MAGPSQTEKLRYAVGDTSHSSDDSFRHVLRNILLVVVLGALTWVFCTALKLGVMASTSYLFAPFEQESSISDYRFLEQHDIPEINTVTHKEQTVMSDEQVEGLFVLGMVMLAGGIIRGLLTRNKAWQAAEGDGASQSISYFLHSYQQGVSDFDPVKERYKTPTIWHACKRIIITFLTLGTGGSGGLEGPVIPVGESLGAFVAKRFGIHSADDLRAMQMAGIAAAVCTLLNAPFASAIFAAEVVFSSYIVYRTLLYSIFSVIVAFSLNTLFLGQGKLFVIAPHSVSYNLFEYVQVVLIAILCSGPVGIGLNYIFRFFKNHFNYIPLVARAAIGASGAFAIATLVWFWLGVEPTHVLGMGEETIEHLLVGGGNPQLHVWWVLLLIIVAKGLATGMTLMTGGSAGLLIPAMVLGGCMGGALHMLMVQYLPTLSTGLELFVVSGIASALVAIIEVPISAVLLVVSMFGESYAAPAMLSVAVCHLFVRSMRLYMRDN